MKQEITDLILPDLNNLGLNFNYRTADTVICDRIELIEGTIGFRQIDYEVKLNNGVSLQRQYVWEEYQKQEWIWTLLKRRYSPPIAVNKTAESFEIIDGKQRLITLRDFLLNKFSLENGMKFSDLPMDYQHHLLWDKPILGYMAVNLNDSQKVEWFCHINFAGTPQDKAHLEQLRQLKLD